MNFIRTLKSQGLLGLLLLCCTGLLAQPDVSGTETLVNTTTAAAQQRPAVAQAANGDYIVVWESFNQDGSDYGVYFQRFNSAGVAQGSETQVSTTSAYGQRFPSVACDDAGNFAVTWMSDKQDGDGWGVYRRIFDASGTALQSEFRVNSGSTGNQKQPDVAMDASGNFVVVYEDDSNDGDGYGIYMRRVNNAGANLASSELVNDTTRGHQGYPAIDMNASGDFVVVWQSQDTDGDQNGIFAQRYDNTGSKVGNQFQVNTTTSANQQEPDVFINDAGNFTIIWSGYNQDGDQYGIFGQQYTAAGVASGSEFQVNTTTTNSQDHAAIAGTGDGNFAVSWSSYGQDGSRYGVYIQAYDGSAVASGSELLVNDRTADFQQLPAMAWREDSLDLVAAWQSGLRYVTSTQDGDDYGVVQKIVPIATFSDAPPVAVCQDITAYLDGTGNATIVAADVDGGSTDDNGITSYSIDVSAFTCANIGANTVTLTVEDVSGSTSSCTANVTIQDTTSPVAVCQNITAYLNGAGSASLTAGDVDGGSSDNCGVSSISLDNTTFTCANIGSNTGTLTVNDANGNSSTCTANITILDTASPTAVCQNLNLYLDGSGSANITGADLDGGSSDNCGVSGYTASTSSFSCSDIGANAVTLTVSDASGNTWNCTSTVTVIDSTRPTAVCQNLTVYLDGSGAASITSGDVDGGSSDNCGSVSLSVTPSTFACANIGANTVTLTATDGSGNSSTCTSTVTVIDSTRPTAVCQNITVHLGSGGTASVTTGDVDNGSTDNCGVSSTSLDNTSFTCADIGANTTTLTVNDASGNSSTCTANITVLDTNSPSAVCQNLNVYLDGSGAASITAGDIDNGSSDNCSVSGTALNTSSFSCADIGANTVTLTVTDGSGNTATCTGTVTVIDSTSPTPLCQNLTVHLDGSGAASITSGDIDAGSSDNCGTVSLGVSPSTFACANIGANTVTLTATDGSGNSATCTGTVTVIDSTSPTAVCQNITVQLDAAGNATITTTNVDGGSTDNCGISSSSISQGTFDCTTVGANSVTLTVSDASGNSANCTANVTVEDNVAPTAVCQDLTLQLDAAGSASITAADLDNGSSDACGVASLSAFVTSFNCANVGTNTVTLTVTDVNGNASTCNSQVTVEDNIAPTAVCQDVTVQLDASGMASITAADVDGGSTDACGIASLSASTTSFACTNVSITNTVTLTATDVNGNSSTCTANVTVEDNIAPTAVCQNATISLDASGNGTLTTGDIDNGSSDNCGVASLSLDVTSYSCAITGILPVTLTVTDVNGNTASCVGSVTVQDVMAPTAVCQNVTVQLDANGNGSITAADIDGGSTDNCSVSSLSASTTAFTCANVGSNTSTLTVTDNSGNSATCTANVTVQDNVAPTAVCQNATISLDASGNGTLTTGDIDNGSSDNCGVASLSLDVTNYSCTITGILPVIMTVTDVNGNTATCVGSVTVQDVMAPTAVCQDVTVQLDANGNGSIAAADIDGGSTDNCGVGSLSASTTAFTCANVGSNTSTLTVTDIYGNASTCTANVTVEDNIAPTAVCQDITAQLDASGTASFTTTDIDNGSSDNCGIASLSLSHTSFSCAFAGILPVTLTVTDVNGNTSTCISSVTVVDVIAPSAVCQDVTVQLDGTGAGSIIASDIDGGSTDNCGVASLSASTTSFDCSNVGGNTVTLTVADAGGNTSTCTANVTVEDNVAPSAVCQDVTVQLDANGNGSISAADVNNGSSDACGISSLSVTPSSFNCNNVGSNTVTVTVTDVNGNASTCTANVTVEDNIAPSAICQDVTVQLDANGNGSITASDVDNGSGDACGSGVSLSVSNSNFTCINVGGNTVTLTVTDVNGNASTCTANVTVQDNVAPTAVCQDLTVQLDAIGNGSITANDVDNGSSDNCGVASIAVTPTSFTCANVGGNTATLTVTDVNGNTSTCTANITVEDNVAPTAVCQDVTVQLDGNGNASISASDVDNGSSDACGISSLSVTPSSFACANVGSNTVTLTVTDVNGNASTCTANVTVEDNVAPSAVCQDITVQLDANGAATITAGDVDGGSGDACGNAALSVSNTSFACANVGSNTVTLTVTDVNGNASTCTANVTVEDNVAPNAICQDVTVQLDANGNGSITANDIDNGSNDACGVASIAVSPSSFTCANIGGNTVTLTVTDVNGNASTCTANVTVEDNVAPTAVCQDVTVQLDGNGNGSITANDVNNGSSDNCGIASIAVSPSSFTCANVGSNTVTLTVTDVNGNTSTCTANVTVEDNVTPSAICQDVTVQLDANGNGSITANDVNNGSSDNCGVASIAVSPSSFTCANVGGNTATLTVTDVNGNASTCTANVTVQDNVAPTAICQDVTVQLDANGNGSITASDVDNGSSDNCGVASIAVTPTSFTCANVGGNTATLTVTDVNGNTSTCTANITVEDNIAPTAVCQDVTVQLDANGNGSITANDVDNGSSDACGIASIAVSPSSFTCANVGGNTVTLTVTDVNGNASTCTANVTVEDNVAPTANCQQITVQLDANGQASITASQLDNGSTDNCGIASLSVSNSNFSCSDVGFNIVNLTVTDVNGNTATCTGVVTVEDNIAPVASCQDVTLQLDANGSATISAADIDNGSTDACGIASLAVSNGSFACPNVGGNTVTLTVTDVNGNASTCTANVTVEDNVAPNAVCQNITVQLDVNGNASITANDLDGGTTDACGIATFTASNTSFTCADLGTNTVTLTATDVNGNSASCTAQVTVEDNVAPNAVCQDITVQLDANGTATITASDVDGGSSDACGSTTLSVSPSSFTCANVGSNTVTLTVSDQNGNTSSCTANVTVEDNVAPTAVCQNITVQLDANGSATISGGDIDGGSTDNCGIASLAANPNSFSCSDLGTNTATLTVTDNGGNSSTCTAQITVEDNMAPSAVCSDITVYLDVNGLVFVTASDIDGGSTDNCGVSSLSTSAFVYGCGNIGVNSEILTVTDGSGNSAACNALITVADTLDPVVTCQDITIQLDGNGQASISPFDVINNVFDNCGSITCYCDSLSQRDFDCTDLGTNSVFVAAHDVNGNSSNCIAQVTVEDNIAPNAVCQDITVQLDANGTASFTAADIDAGSTDNCSVILSASPTTFGCSDVGSNAVTLTVTDGSGNASTCTAQVTVEDNIAPTALCQDVTVQLDANGETSIAVTDVDAGSSDNCMISSISLSASNFDCSQVGANTVTVTVTDMSGNVSACNAQVTVEDNIAPTANCQDITVQLDANGNTNVSIGDIENGIGDNCGIDHLVISPSTGNGTVAAFDCSQIGANAVTLTVTDVNGNVSTCTSQVTVEDNVAPVAVCQDITVQLDGSGNANITATDVDNGSADNCGVAGLSVSPSSFTCANVGSNAVTLTVTDVNGNASSCTAQVTVEDVTAPTAACQDLIVQMDVSGTTIVSANDIDNGSSDNCGFTLSTTNNAFNCNDILSGGRNLTLTVTDASGNSSTCTALVTVVDTTYSICCPYTFDFETTAAGTATQRGEIITNQWAQYGIEISAINNNGPDAALIFDSNIPGNNSDLGTPNQQYGGPGTGNGGSSNSVAEDMVLVIARNVNDNNNDGLVDNPNDDNDGGQIFFDFTNQSMTISTVSLLDVQGTWDIILEKTNGSVVTVPVSASGNNSAQTVPVFESDVRRMSVSLSRGGAITGFTFCPDGNEYTACNTPLDFDRDDNGGFVAEGSIITNQWELSRNVIISAQNNNNSHPDAAIIFNSADPTGNDDDLGTPNDIYGGPGIGNGGSSNDVPEFNILVIAQNVNDTDNDGLVDNPSDENQGGSIRFDFTNYASVDSIKIIDNQRNNSTLVAELLGGGTQTITLPNTGNNGVATVPINLTNVAALTVNFQRTGGIADLHFCADGAPVTGSAPAGGSGVPSAGTNGNSGAGAGSAQGESGMTVYPNPFTEKSTLTFFLNHDDDVTLKIYDLRGVEVANLFEGRLVEGELIDVEFAPNQISRGVYIARLVTGNGEVMVRKLVYE